MDCMPASITIGGTLDRKHLMALCRAANADGAGIEWGDGTLDPDGVEELAAAGSNTLCLMNDEASYGLLDALEAFCHEHDLTYRVESDGKYEHDGQVNYWQPGWEQTKCFTGSQGGEIMVPIGDLKGYRDAGESLDAIIAKFDMPEVPAFQLVGVFLDDTNDEEIRRLYAKTGDERLATLL